MPHSSPASAAASFPSSLPRLSRPRSPVSASLRIGVSDIIDLAHNKVLIAAAASCAIGQLSKPLTSALNGGGIDLSAAVRSGGMPSTHSAGVAAAATSLGLVRGFSDPIFGVSAVFAVFVMYDAQGVRREVGYHAKILNWLLKTEGKFTPNGEEDDSDDFKSAGSITSNNSSPQLSKEVNSNTLNSSSEYYSSSRAPVASRKLRAERTNMYYTHIRLLNESVGHTEIQVIVGAILGFIVSLTVDAIL